MAFKRVTLSLDEESDKELDRISRATHFTRSEVTRGALFFLGQLSPEAIVRILKQHANKTDK
jgi:predicted transcriptional regulator